MIANLKLEVFHNGEFLKEFDFSGESLWLGRDEDCFIRLDDRAISRKHALIRATENGIEFEKKSKFGHAKVNGKDVEQVMLQGGERLEMGSYEIRVKTEQAKAVNQVTTTLPAATEASIQTVAPLAEEGVEGVEYMPGLEQSALPESEPEAPNPFQGFASEEKATGTFDFARVDNDAATRVFKSSSLQMKPILEFGDGLANVSFYEISDPEIAIGRSQKCHVVLEDKRSSRKHSFILLKNGKYFIKDLGSANGTLLNGERVDEQELQSGDVIKIGDTQFTFKMVQLDYEQKKAEFFQVPQEEAPPVAQPFVSQMAQPLAPIMANGGVGAFQDFNLNLGATHDEISEPIAPDFTAPPEEKGSLIGKLLQRFRTMNTKQQIIWGGVVLALVYLGLDDEPEKKRPRLNMGVEQKRVEKKSDKKSGGVSFEMLTPEQQAYIDSTYVIAFDHYKNREYDKSLLELGKIFSIVQDYKNAREIDTYAREGKRKLEAQEEERKKKEQERQAQLRLQELLDKAGLLMEQGKYRDAEALFPEIEIMQPENAAVSAWRKKVIEEDEKAQKESVERKRIQEINQKARADFNEGLALVKEKRYFDALDIFDEIAERPSLDKKLSESVRNQIKQVEGTIASERDPFLAQGKQLEQEGKFPEAYKAFQKASEIDPTDTEAPAGMKRIQGTLNATAKALYSEGVIAEGFGDFDAAEKKYKEVTDVVPEGNSYYTKAKARLKGFSTLRRSMEGPPK